VGRLSLGRAVRPLQVRGTGVAPLGRTRRCSLREEGGCRVGGASLYKVHIHGCGWGRAGAGGGGRSMDGGRPAMRERAPPRSASLAPTACLTKRKYGCDSRGNRGGPCGGVCGSRFARLTVPCVGGVDGSLRPSRSQQPRAIALSHACHFCFCSRQRTL
jgi:hypothetical protein